MPGLRPLQCCRLAKKAMLPCAGLRQESTLVLASCTSCMFSSFFLGWTLPITQRQLQVRKLEQGLLLLQYCAASMLLLLDKFLANLLLPNAHLVLIVMSSKTHSASAVHNMTQSEYLSMTASGCCRAVVPIFDQVVQSRQCLSQ